MRSTLIQGVGRLQVLQALYDLLGVAVDIHLTIRVERQIRPAAPDYAYG